MGLDLGVGLRDVWIDARRRLSDRVDRDAGGGQARVVGPVELQVVGNPQLDLLFLGQAVGAEVAEEGDRWVVAGRRGPRLEVAPVRLAVPGELLGDQAG